MASADTGAQEAIEASDWCEICCRPVVAEGNNYRKRMVRGDLTWGSTYPVPKAPIALALVSNGLAYEAVAGDRTTQFLDSLS